MAEIINLRAVKKAKVRAKSRVQGDENAAKFGRSKAQRKSDEQQAAKAQRDLDGHRREPT
jgi:hypothetical protein